MKFWDKISYAINKISSKYVLLCSDDDYIIKSRWSRLVSTGPFEELIWAPRKGPENEKETIHNRNQDSHPTVGAEQRNVMVCLDSNHTHDHVLAE